MIDGVQIPMQMDNFEGGAVHRKVYGHSTVSYAKTAELIEMPFGMWTLAGPRKHVLDGCTYTGATRRIRLDSPCAAAMRPFCQMVTCCK